MITGSIVSGLQVPSYGLSGFLTDYTLLDLEKEEVAEQRCEQCEEGGKTVSYCKTCADYICEECLQAHKKLKPLRHHETISISEDVGDTKADSECRQKRSFYCSIHPNESLKLFCKTCQTLACLHCFITTHNGHDIGSMDNRRTKELRKNIRELIREANLTLKEFEDNLMYIQMVDKEKKDELEPLKASINKKVDFCIAQLETRRKQLLKDAEEAHTKDTKELWAQKEYHEAAITHLKGALSFAKRSLKVREDIQMFAVSAEVIASLQQLSQLRWDSQETEIIEMTSIRFGNPDFDQFHLPVVDFKALGEVHKTISPPEIEIMSKNIPSTVKVGSPVQVHVKATLTLLGRDMLMRTYGDMNMIAMGTVRRKEKVENVQVQVFKDNEDLWTIQFTPQHKGTYSICIEAQSAYGLQVVSNKYRYNIFAQR